MAACTVGKDKHARDGSAGRKSQGIGRQTEQGLADSVLEVSIQANEWRMEEWKGEGNMGPALMRVMKTELEVFKKEAIQKGMEKGMQEGLQEGMKQGIQEGMQQGLQEGMQQGMQQGMQKSIEILQDLGYESGKIARIVKEKYNLTDE